MKNGYTCAIKSVLDDEDVYASDEFLANVQGDPVMEDVALGIKTYGNLNLQAACVQLTMGYQEYYYVSPAFVGSSDARTAMENLMKNAFEYDLNGQTAAQMIQGLFNDTYNTLKNKFDK